MLSSRGEGMRIATLMTVLAMVGCRTKDSVSEDGERNGADSGVVTVTDLDSEEQEL